MTGAGGGVFLLTELPQGLRENSWCQLWQTDRQEESCARGAWESAEDVTWTFISVTVSQWPPNGQLVGKKRSPKLCF